MIGCDKMLRSTRWYEYSSARAVGVSDVVLHVSVSTARLLTFFLGKTGKMVNFAEAAHQLLTASPPQLALRSSLTLVSERL